jgi:hypothetical protein
MIPARIDPDNPRRNLYRLFNRLTGRFEAWTVIELAIRSNLDKSTVQFRLDHWSEEDVIDPVIDFYEQTADYRAGRPLQKRLWIDDPKTIGPADEVRMYGVDMRQMLFLTHSEKRARARSPFWCGFYAPCSKGIMGFESVIDQQAFRVANPKRGPGRPYKPFQPKPEPVHIPDPLKPRQEFIQAYSRYQAELRKPAWCKALVKHGDGFIAFDSLVASLDWKAREHEDKISLKKESRK